MHQIAQLTSGYSGSDLAALARDAAYGPIRWTVFFLAPSNLSLLQRAEDRRGEVFGPGKSEEDQHERLPGSYEADKKVRGLFVQIAKTTHMCPPGLSQRTAWCRTRPGTRSLERARPSSHLSEEYSRLSNIYAFVTLYIYIASLEGCLPAVLVFI